MKYIKYIVLSGLIGLFLGSCKQDTLDPVLHLNGVPVITAPAAGANIELKEANANDALPDFTWTGMDYGFAAGTTYKLEMDLAGNNFAGAVTLGNVNALKVSGVTQGDINNILLAKGQEGETSVPVELRVTATVNPDVAPVVSNTLAMSFVTFTSTVVYPQLQVPGSYQSPTPWDPTNNATVIYSLKSDSKYEGFVNFGVDNAQFKYTVGLNWDVNYGDTGADGTLDSGGDNILAGPAGLYKLNVDLVALTHSFTRTDWGLIGSATPDGWNSDQNMTYDPVTQKISITIDLIAGDIKFRANDAWDINFGDDGNNKTLEYNGANIPVAEAGNYTIDLLIVGVAKYKYAIKKN